MIELSDGALHSLLNSDPERGWHAFVEQYTPTLEALIERAGVTDSDDRSDVYIRVCERLAAESCARLRQHDPSKGALAAWLTIVVRHAVVDWVRSRTGRRRLFGAIARLGDFDRRVFELFYWGRHRVTEIVEMVSRGPTERVSMADVFDALARIESALSDRQRGQLLAMSARSGRPVALEGIADEPPVALVDRRPDPEAALHAKRLDGTLASALAGLAPEDAAIVRMLFVHGWALNEVQRALHLTTLTRDHVRAILARLRSALEARGVRRGESGTSGLAFLEDEAK